MQAEAELAGPIERLRLRPRAHGLLHGDLHPDKVLLDGDQVGLVDFEDCCWGYYAYDVASLLDSFRRRVLSAEAYPAAREAFLDGYTFVFGPLEDATETLAACKALRDAVTLQFVLASVNESVLEWAPARIDELINHIEGDRDAAASDSHAPAAVCESAFSPPQQLFACSSWPGKPIVQSGEPVAGRLPASSQACRSLTPAPPARAWSGAGPLAVRGRALVAHPVPQTVLARDEAVRCIGSSSRTSE